MGRKSLAGKRRAQILDALRVAPTEDGQRVPSKRPSVLYLVTSAALNRSLDYFFKLALFKSYSILTSCLLSAFWTLEILTSLQGPLCLREMAATPAPFVLFLSGKTRVGQFDPRFSAIKRFPLLLAF
jgi:hypothetical protein